MTDTDTTEENVIDITINVTGNAVVLVNGEVVEGEEASHNKLHIVMKEEGDVKITVNGDDFEGER
jgi:uncharacterized protein YjfI (DUF2170 family)